MKGRSPENLQESHLKTWEKDRRLSLVQALVISTRDLNNNICLVSRIRVAIRLSTKTNLREKMNHQCNYLPRRLLLLPLIHNSIRTKRSVLNLTRSNRRFQPSIVSLTTLWIKTANKLPFKIKANFQLRLKQEALTNSEMRQYSRRITQIFISMHS